MGSKATTSGQVVQEAVRVVGECLRPYANHIERGRFNSLLEEQIPPLFTNPGPGGIPTAFRVGIAVGGICASLDVQFWDWGPEALEKRLNSLLHGT